MPASQPFWGGFEALPVSAGITGQWLWPDRLQGRLDQQTSSKSAAETELLCPVCLWSV